MVLFLRGLGESWSEQTFEQKCECFSNDGDVFFYFGQYSDKSRRAAVCSLLNECMHSRNEPIINEIYFDILARTEEISFDAKIVEILWVLLKLDGTPFDNYWIYMNLNEMYSINLKDIQSAYNVCYESYKEMEFYLPYFKETYIKMDKSLSDDNYLPSYVFCRDQLIYNLIDQKKFNESEDLENEMILRGLYLGDIAKKRLEYNRQLRLIYHIPYLLKQSNIDLAIEKTKELSLINEISGSLHYKRIANEYYKVKDYTLALKYYQISIELNPQIPVVEKKIEITKRKIKKTGANK